MSIDAYSDNTPEKIACGMIAHLLLKNGHSPTSVAEALSVKQSFVNYMHQDGVKNGFFQATSQNCQMFLRTRPRPDRVDFLACHRRILAPDTPPDIFCSVWGMSLAELQIAESYIKAWKDIDPTRLLSNKKRRPKNPLILFFNQQCVFGSQYQCDIKVLFEAWCNFKPTGLKSICIQSFGRRLKKMYSTIDSVKYRVEGGFSRKYIGIGLKPQQPSN